ncbi:MAG: hypothetical protein E6J91_20010 [Deltaproteobacteria bacterium]|nr:MAG: hypothetical protein E6J91_20010 [Deltaproteobacteria bacterium]
MSSDNPFTPAVSIEPLWRLLAIGLDPDKTVPDLYGAIHEGEPDVPLMVDGRIVFFTDPGRAAELIRQHGGTWATDPMEVDKPTLWCDVAQALHHLSAGGIDDSASVVDAVNVLLDLVKASGTKMVDSRRRALHSIADYCTTSKNLTKYLEEVGDHSSRELVDAVLWCVGAVVVNSRFL